MKISKQTAYAINWLYNKGSNITSIAEELSLQPNTVQEYIEKNNIQNEANLATKSQPVRSSKDLMIRHTREKNTNNVSIMTKEASAYNDDAKKKLLNKQKNQDHIFKPNK
jgi:predicted transcriptional regulator